MLWRDRKVLLALGATAVMGLLFGMLLATLTSGSEGSPPAGQAANTTGSNPSESEPGQTSAPASPRPTDLRDLDYGYLTEVRTGGDQPVLRFDRVDFLIGEEATEKCQEENGEPCDYYVSNVNQRIRERVVSADVKVFGSQRLTGSPEEKEIAADQLYDYVNDGEGTNMLITLRYDQDTGEVTEIKEVYLP